MSNMNKTISSEQRLSGYIKVASSGLGKETASNGNFLPGVDYLRMEMESDERREFAKNCTNDSTGSCFGSKSKDYPKQPLPDQCVVILYNSTISNPVPKTLFITRIL